MFEPVKVGGMGFGPWSDRQAVSGRLRFFPREVKDLLVSPRPWRRMRMLSGWPDEGGMMSRVKEEEKSAFVGRRGAVILARGLGLGW